MNQKQDMIGLVRHEDVIQPFMLHNSVMRGRMVRLDHTLNAILRRHSYEDVVSKQLGELLVLGGMLSANLPDNGILTLQVKGDGAVSFMVVDVRQDGSIRGYANVKEEKADFLKSLDPHHAILPDVLGKGYLAMTFDNGLGEPYQGIVPLDGDSLSDALEYYFSQSQQLDVAFHIHTSKRIRENNSFRWVAAGIMLERMPETSVQQQQNSLSENHPDANNWDFGKLLIETATEEELSDPHLAPSALLYRLFHQIGVWVYDTKPIIDQCHCSPTRFEDVLCSMTEEELSGLAEEGKITITCQFCSREQCFLLEDLLKRKKEASQSGSS